MLHERVDLDEAALHLDAVASRPKFSVTGAAADGDEQQLGLDGVCCLPPSSVTTSTPLSVRSTLEHLGAGHDVDAPLAKAPC